MGKVDWGAAWVEVLQNAPSPRGNADEYTAYIDSLNVMRNPVGFKPAISQPTVLPPLSSSNRRSHPLKQTRTGLTIAVACATLAATWVVGCVAGGVGVSIFSRLANPVPAVLSAPLPASSSAPAATPAVTPTVTVTTTVVAAPETCLAAVRQVLLVIEQASRTASASSKQLDIISKAYQAILLGDAAKLNAAAELQRQLEHELKSDSVVVLQWYQKIEDGLATCQA